MREKLVKNSIYNGLATFLTAVIGFFLIPFMIGKLGVVEFGLIGIAYIFSIGGYLSLVEMGFQASITKYTAEYLNKGDHLRICQLTSTILAVFVPIGMVMLLFGIGVYSFEVAEPLMSYLLQIPGEYHSSFRLALALIFSSYLYQLPNVVFTGLLSGAQRFDLLKGTDIAVALLNAFLIVVLLSGGFGYVSVIVVSVGLLGAQCMMYAYWAFRHFPFLKIGRSYVSRGLLREIGGMTRLVFTAKISSLAFHQTSRLLVGTFLGPIAMTYYQAVTKVPKAIKTLFGFMNETVMPASSELASAGRKSALDQLFLRGLRYQLFFNFPVCTGAMFFATPFLTSWLGPEFGHLGYMMHTVLLWTLVSPFIAIGSAICLGMEKRLKEITVLSVVTTIANIGIALALIKTYGLYGVLIGTVVSVMVVLPFYLRIFLEEFNMRLSKLAYETGKIFMPVIVPLLVFYGFGLIDVGSNLVILLIEGSLWCILYWLVLYVTVVDDEDKKLLRLFGFRREITSESHS